MITFKHCITSTLTAIALCGLANPSLAQNLFDPVAQVDEATITEFEVRQRALFLQLVGSPDSSREEVIRELIRDRLRETEATLGGLTLTSDELQQGLSDVAARANLTAEEFVAGLESEGVARETFRDFVATSLIWRDYIRARYGSRVNITDREIDGALAASGGSVGIEVLLSEIIVPAPPQRAQQVIELAEQMANSQSESEFSSFARRFSATASRGRGGLLDWTPISDLPPVLRPLLLALAPGEVTAPLPIPNAVALFQLRDIRETDVEPRSYSAIEYAAYYIAGGRTPETLGRARTVAAGIDRCDDLYGVAQGQPENVLDRGSLPPDEIPTDIAIELAKLDPGETSIALTRADGNTLVLLMLCGRTPQLAEDQEVNREGIAGQLRSQRLNAFSESLLSELEAEATIRIYE